MLAYQVRAWSGSDSPASRNRLAARPPARAWPSVPPGWPPEPVRARSWPWSPPLPPDPGRAVAGQHRPAPSTAPTASCRPPGPRPRPIHFTRLITPTRPSAASGPPGRCRRREPCTLINGRGQSGVGQPGRRLDRLADGLGRTDQVVDPVKLAAGPGDGRLGVADHQWSWSASSSARACSSAGAAPQRQRGRAEKRRHRRELRWQ